LDSTERGAGGFGSTGKNWISAEYLKTSPLDLWCNFIHLGKIDPILCFSRVG